MLSAKDLELPYLAMEEDTFAANPFPHFERARAMHPWRAHWKLGSVVTDYKAMRELFMMENRMGMLYDDIMRIMDAKGTPWGDFQQRHMLSLQAPHTSAFATCWPLGSRHDERIGIVR